MTLPRFALAPLALLALAARPAREEIAFRVEADTTLGRRLESGYSLQLDSTTLALNGVEMPGDEIDIRLQHADTFVVTDVFEAVADGRPRRLRRTFDELGMNESARFSNDEGEYDQASDYESALEGKTVVFTWNDEAERFDAAFAEGVEDDEALLESLDEDMDLRRLLPPGPVSEGESWSIDPHAFSAVLDPGGDLALEDIRAQHEEHEKEDASDKKAQMHANMAGTITATYEGTLEEDGVQQAVIALSCETDTGAGGPISDEIPEGTSGHERVEVRFRLEGELRWDLDHGHALSLELSGANEFKTIQTFAGELEGERLEMSQTLAYSGEAHYSMRFERR